MAVCASKLKTVLFYGGFSSKQVQLELLLMIPAQNNKNGRPNMRCRCSTKHLQAPSGRLLIHLISVGLLKAQLLELPHPKELARSSSVESWDGQHQSRCSKPHPLGSKCPSVHQTSWFCRMPQTRASDIQ